MRQRLAYHAANGQADKDHRPLDFGLDQRRGILGETLYRDRTALIRQPMAALVEADRTDARQQGQHLIPEPQVGAQGVGENDGKPVLSPVAAIMHSPPRAG